MEDDRRHFFRTAAMAMVASQLGGLGAADAVQGESRELAALGRGAEWLNSPRLTAAGLRGKVVLVDFWTYTCINWMRTLPYSRIGVHVKAMSSARQLAINRHAKT